MIHEVRGSRRRRRTALATAVAISLATVVGCTASSSGSGDGTTDEAGDGGTSARTAAPGQAESKEKIPEFTLGIMGKIPQLDPVDNIEAGLSVNMNALEPLLRVDKSGEIQPWLATGYEAVSDTVYEYTLREGVKFWDGTELTSEDVKYTWDRSIELDGRPGFASVDTIETPDKYTVRVTLSQPDAAFQYTPTQFYAAIYQKDHAERSGDSFGQPDTLVMGTGPWQVDNLSPTTGMQLSAFEDYWGGPPPIEQLSVKFFADDNAMALALRSGEIDLAQGIASPDVFDAAAGGGTIRTAPTCATALIAMPTDVAPWDDVHVRRAVAHAINREDIIAATQGRAGAPLETLISPMMLDPLGSDEEVEDALASIPRYEHDVEKAKEELAKSSVPDGFSVEFKVITSNSSVAEVVAAQLTEIGIDTTVVAMQDTAWYAEIGKPEKPFTFSETGACTPDPSWDDIFLATDESGEPTGINVAGYAPPDVIDLRTQGLTTSDPGARLRIYTDLLTRLAEDVPYVPVYAEGATYASSMYDVAEYGSYVLNYPWLLNLMRR